MIISASYALAQNAQLSRALRKAILRCSSSFSSPFSSSAAQRAKNRTFDPVRSPADFETLLLLHTSRRAPLLTFWTASWCRTCAELEPLIRHLIEMEATGLEQGGVGYVQIELDSPTIGDLGARYPINSIPTMLAFSRGEPQWATRVTDAKILENKEFMTSWIESEAKRGGKGGEGGSFFSGLFRQ